jgi:NAD(P)-dependent dehydrogenase (short-subunit alcohol dehydrogenase family)
MDLQLNGRRALITGGSRGLGKAIARELGREGVDCAICARHEGPLNETAEELKKETGRKVVPIVADTSNAESIERLVSEAAGALGGIDILINNAARVAGGDPEDFWHVKDELILRDFEEKLLGYFRCARAVAPMMRDNGWGRIINLSGYAARSAGSVPAGARNASTVHLTKTLSLELGKYGITVNAIYPATTITETFINRFGERARSQGKSVEEVMAEMGKNNHIGRLVTSEEIAYVVTFLCSPLAAGVSGDVIAVSGGQGNGVYY